MLACLLYSFASAELTIVEDGESITVTNGNYSVAFDKSRGGAISKIGKRAVNHQDRAGEFVLGGDPKPEIKLKKSAQKATLFIKAFYLNNGERSPSRIRAEYRYDFHADSPAVSLKAVIRQSKVPLHADVYGYPAWREVRILSIGGEIGAKKSFGGDRLQTKVFFLPGADKPFDVTPEVVKKLTELVRPVISRGKQLFKENFKDNSRWIDIRGKWIVESGTLAEKSPDGQWAWTVAGDKSWSNYIVESDVLSNNGCHLYLCARWLDLDNHYELQYLEWPVNGLRINRVVKGKRRTLGEVRDLPDLRIRPFTRLAFAVQGDRLRAYRNGELVIEVNDNTLSRGRVALGAVSDNYVWFHNLNVYEAEAGRSQIPKVNVKQPIQRHGFYRDEKDATIHFLISSEKPLDGAVATFVMTSDLYPTHGELLRKEVRLGSLEGEKAQEVPLRLTPSNWRSGDYVITATVRKGRIVFASEETHIYLRRRPNPDRMLVNAWDGPGTDPKRLAEYGFNQFKLHHENTMSRWTSDGKYRQPDNPMRMFSEGAEAKRQHIIDQFDEALKHGIWAYIHLDYIGRVAEGVTESYALKRDGSGIQDRATGHFGANNPRPNPWHPKSVEVIQDFFAGILPAWKDMPAWRAVLLNSESERHLDVYGNAYWLKMAEKELGFKVPEDVSRAWGMKGKQLPEDGIVESDDPHYRFYRWWHERGEGQGVLHAKVAETVKSIRSDVNTWHDPALRQPYVRGRLAGLDQIMHWSYAWPNVSRFSLIADELRLAALESQEHIFMLQLIWFSSIPVPHSGPHWPHIKRSGKTYHGAHSPTIVREGTWLALSRGVSGMSYHGVATADRRTLKRDDPREDVEGIGYKSYMYSNPDSLLAIKDMSERVMQPYGMVIKRLKPAKGKVVMLLSTANAVLTDRGAEDMIMKEAGHIYAKLQAAHVPVDAAFEVNLEENGLDGYKAIALPGCKVIPRHLYDMIRKFETGGGLVIADQYLVPKFSNVLTLPRKAPAWRGEAALEKEHIDQARDVHRALDSRITRWADCDSPSVILSVLEHESDKYLFTINNLRRTGDYMKPWGRVLDDGVAQETVVRIRQADCIIYDALAREKIVPRSSEGWMSWNVRLGPGEGRIFVVRTKPIKRIKVNAPDSVEKGGQVKVAISIEDDGGQNSKGLVPLRITVKDSQGTVRDASDYYLTQDGRAEISLSIAKNDPSGDWSVTARELYGGNKGRTFFNVAIVESTAVKPRPKRSSPGLVEVPEMWLFHTDPKKIGEKEKWFAPSDKTKTWQPLSTHGFWDEAAGVGYEGIGWYAIDLEIPPVKGKRVKLIFGAVDENYTFWINGKYISDNLAAGTTMWDKPITIDITKHYDHGKKNHLVVRVRNTLKAGGIWKPVKIVAED